MSESEPEIEKYRKAGRNRHKTECAVIRSKSGCGICGSENTASQGVRYCEICGEETEFFIDDSEYFRFGRDDDVNCDCLAEHTFRGRTRWYRRLNWIAVGKCLDCGAVRSSFCPNGKNVRLCWQSASGQKYCQRCGYRRSSVTVI